MSTDLALLRLLTWFSPAFPTGAFAHSHGLERAVEDGWVASEAHTASWIEALLRTGSGWSDAILFRHAHGAEDAAALAELGAFALALPAARELREETAAQGEAFRHAAAAWPAPRLPLPLLAAADARLAHPVAAGALARAHGIGVEPALRAFLHGFAANLVSAALRLVPLGQTAALRVQAALEPVIEATAAASRDCGLDALGTSCFRSDVASMRHETQGTRLFRT